MTTDLVPTEQAVVEAEWMTETGLHLPESTDFETWEQVGRLLTRAAKASLWWLGDWIRFGERKYGETYAQAVEMSGLEVGTLTNAVWVAEKIEISRRRENLSWSHHYEVASIEDPDVADAWLDAAGHNGWSRNDLRAKLREAKAKGAGPEGAEEDEADPAGEAASVSVVMEGDDREVLEDGARRVAAAVGKWFSEKGHDVTVSIR